MQPTDPTQPFHSGELMVQARAGAGDMAARVGGFIRDHLPLQHRQFHSALPFLVVSGGDLQGRTWVTLIDGPDGFISAPDPRRLRLDTRLSGHDPLARAVAQGTEIGVLGIDPSSRRRNRFSGVIRPDARGHVIEVRQSFGNCPQYIQPRGWVRSSDPLPGQARHAERLSPDQMARIGKADTLFIGSGHLNAPDRASRGFDASHRGGAPGFVKVLDPNHLRIPDYAGNNFFNTLGNLALDPRVGLLFVDFETGGLLHLSGRARIDWSPDFTADPAARRWIEIRIDAVLDRPGAVALRWHRLDHQQRALQLVARRAETEQVSSFLFAAADGQPLWPFRPGQHLPIQVTLPGAAAPDQRTYSLSGPALPGAVYRLTVKREDRGRVSRFLHDHLRPGDRILARPPAGSFCAPPGEAPLVLISAGVGITPMVPILHAAVARGRAVHVFHAAPGPDDEALGAEIATLVGLSDRARLTRFYRPSKARADIPDADPNARVTVIEGRLTADAVLTCAPGDGAHFLLCGPAGFLSDLSLGLAAAGVARDAIHAETFGPIAG